MRTFTGSWWLPVSKNRSAIRLNFELYDLHFGTTPLAFKADICMRWKGILIQWLSEPFFYYFLCNSKIGIMIIIDVIDLSEQIIEFGKDRDDRNWKNVNLEWKLERWDDRNLSLPSPFQRTSIPMETEAELRSEQNKTFLHRTDHQWPVCTLR